MSQDGINSNISMYFHFNSIPFNSTLCLRWDYWNGTNYFILPFTSKQSANKSEHILLIDFNHWNIVIKYKRLQFGNDSISHSEFQFHSFVQLILMEIVLIQWDYGLYLGRMEHDFLIWAFTCSDVIGFKTSQFDDKKC